MGIKDRLVPAVIGIIFGIVGMMIAYAVIHVYNDHLVFHNLINNIIAQQAQQKQGMK